MSFTSDTAMSLAAQILLRVPLLVAVLVGGVMFAVFRQRLGGPATAFGLTACVLLVLDRLASTGWWWYISHAPEYIHEGGMTLDTFKTVANVYAVVSSLMIAVAMTSLLVAALVRRPADRVAQRP